MHVTITARYNGGLEFKTEVGEKFCVWKDGDVVSIAEPGSSRYPEVTAEVKRVGRSLIGYKGRKK